METHALQQISLDDFYEMFISAPDYHIMLDLLEICIELGLKDKYEMAQSIILTNIFGHKLTVA